MYNPPPMRVQKARQELEFSNEERKEAVKNELIRFVFSDIRDVIDWDTGTVRLRNLDEIPPDVTRFIKKVKINNTATGQTIEVEMHDKMRSLGLLARHFGIDRPEMDHDIKIIAPQVIGPDDIPEEKK